MSGDGGNKAGTLAALCDRLMTANIETPVPDLKNMFHFPPNHAEDRNKNVDNTAR